MEKVIYGRETYRSNKQTKNMKISARIGVLTDVDLKIFCFDLWYRLNYGETAEKTPGTFFRTSNRQRVFAERTHTHAHTKLLLTSIVTFTLTGHWQIESQMAFDIHAHDKHAHTPSNCAGCGWGTQKSSYTAYHMRVCGSYGACHWHCSWKSLATLLPLPL